MNPAAEAVFYDGISARPQPAQVLALDNQAVLVKYGLQLEQQRRYAYADMALIGALGAIQPIIELKDDARLEFQGPLPEWFNLGSKARSHSIWKLERTPSLEGVWGRAGLDGLLLGDALASIESEKRP